MENCLVPTMYLCQWCWFSSSRYQSGGRDGWQDFSCKSIKLVCGRVLQNKRQHLAIMKFLIPEKNDKIFACSRFSCTYWIWAASQRHLIPFPCTGVRWCWTGRERPPIPPSSICRRPDGFRPFSDITVIPRKPSFLVCIWRPDLLPSGINEVFCWLY